MSFRAAEGNWTNIKTPTKAQVTYTSGMVIANDGTNDVPVTTQTKQYIRGITLEDKASSSATTSITLNTPRDASATFYGDMTSGETLSETDVGKSYDFHSDGLTVSTNTTYGPVTLVQYLDTDKGKFKFNLQTGVES